MGISFAVVIVTVIVSVLSGGEPEFFTAIVVLVISGSFTNLWCLISLVLENTSCIGNSNMGLCKILAQRAVYKVKPGTKQGWKCRENMDSIPKHSLHH